MLMEIILYFILKLLGKCKQVSDMIDLRYFKIFWLLENLVERAKGECRKTGSMTVVQVRDEMRLEISLSLSLSVFPGFG